MKTELLIIQQSLVGGGAERVLIDLLQKLDYTKYNVTLLLVYDEGVYLKDIPTTVKKLFIFKNIQSFQSKLFNKLPTAIQRKIIQRKFTQNYDTIISFMEGLSLKIHSFIYKKAKKNITWVHIDLQKNNWPLKVKQFTSKEEEEKCYCLMDEIIFVSDKARTAFNSVFKNIDSKQHIIYNIVNTSKIREQASTEIINKRKFTICNIGRLSDQKRQDRLIEAIKIVKDHGIDLEAWILGIGPKEQELSKLIKRHKLEETVFLMGFFNNPYPYIKAADIFVLSSDTEGYPIVICESLVLGKPIIATNITGTTELLGNSEYGILTDLSARAIAQQIIFLHNNPDRIDKLSQAAIHRAQIFDSNLVLKEIYTIIN